MAQPNNLTTTGRQDLDTVPKPTTPPEAAPRISQLASGPEGDNAPSIGSLQQSGIILQTGMAVEKGILALASLLPQFAEEAQQLATQVRTAITRGLSGAQAQGGPTPAGGSELPATQVSPLQ